MNRLPVTVLTLLVAILLAAAQAWADISPRGRPLVDLGARTGAAPIRVAGRTVPDLAVADQLLVGLQQGVGTVRAASAAVNMYGGRVMHEISDGRTLLVDLPEGSDILAVADRLRIQSGIAFAEPNRVVYSTGRVPDDPEYPKQWHLPKIQAPEAWEIGTGSPEVIIAVVDSGIDLTHPDLADQIWRNPGEISNGMDSDGNGYVDDIQGWNFYDRNNDVRAIPTGRDLDGDGKADSEVNHGTLVAGLAAAAANGWGTVGVAWRATIMPLKIFPSDGTTTVAVVVEAMNYAADNGAHLMNLSIGTPYSDSFTDPIVKMWNRGGLTVTAGGNDGRELRDSRSSWVSPTCNTGPNPLADNMNLGVGGVDTSDRKASWSNWDGSTAGHFIDVCAPGVNLYGPAVYYPSVSGFSTYFTSNSGTSFAAALVTGLAALLKAQDMNRTGADLIRMIRESADNIDSANPGYAGKLGGGRINAARAMGADLPVAPPTNVEAFDTPGDDGGSITVTWTRSVDDGAGSNRVTGYVISRARGSSGGGAPLDWGDIASVPAGTERYEDATTTDGVPHYYRVASLSAEGRTPSEVVGPVYSRDDLPPPQVLTLTAQDRPLDTGGAIVLDWTGYPGADDLVKFHIYRRNRPFSSVVGRTPIAILTDPAARTYTDETTVDGADYFYAVTGVDALGNENRDVVSVGPVQSFPNGPVTIPAGLRLMGTPAIPASRHPADLFGVSGSALKYARYNPAISNYEVYSGGTLSEFLELGLGRGFWVNLAEPATVYPEGNVAPAGNVNAELGPGWRQVSNPYFGNMNFAACTVTVGGNTMDLASADALGVMAGYGWMHDPVTRDYILLHPNLTDTTVPAWGGFWVRADQPCTFTLARPGGAVAGAEDYSYTAVADREGEWPLQIIARGARDVDASNYFGVSTAAKAIQAPPPAGSLSLSFAPPSGRDDGAVWAASFEPSARQRMTWDMAVTWTRPQDTVTLQWPDVSRVPHDISLTLHDLDAGRRVSMRHVREYGFAAGDATGRRNFRIEATRGAAGAVRITSASALTTGSGGQVVFSLSAEAACDVTVMNIAGRPVRTVEEGRLRPAGTSVVVWDGRGSGGAPVPPGQYLVRITARSEDGASASALRTMRVQR